MNKIGNFLISLVIFTTCFISNGILAGSKVYFIHSDHLSTPQVITDADQQVVWKVENQSAFGGETEIDQDGDGEELVFNLRFPGQYFDSETGLYYNYYRDYDPSIGRYIQSDPIGLDGGINTYVYAENNPFNYSDPFGLIKWTGTVYAVGGGGKGAAAVKYIFTLTSECVDGKKYKVKVESTGYGIGAGLPAGTSGGGIEFNDGQSIPDPEIFNGKFTAVGASAVLGMGIGFAGIRSGLVHSSSFGTTQGADLSAVAVSGWSGVTDIEELDCECED